MTYKFGTPSAPIGIVTDVAGTQSTDASTGIVFSVTLNAAGTNTLENPTDLQEGQEYTWQLKQDAVTAVDVTFGDNFYFVDGTAPIITQTPGAVDIIRATALDTGSGVKLYSEFEADVEAIPSYSNTYSVDFVAASSQYLLLDDSGSGLNFDGTSPFSISFWIKPHFAQTGMPVTHVIGKSLGSGGGYMGYHLYYYGTALTWDVINNASTSYITYYGASPTPINTWTHLVLVYTNTTTTEVFVNGASMAGTLSGSITTPISTSAEFSVGVTPLHAATYFDGQIDELSVWSAALNSTQAAAIYNSGTPTDLTGMSNLTNWWRMGDDPSDDLTGTTGKVGDVVSSLDLTPYNTTSANKVADVP